MLKWLDWTGRLVLAAFALIIIYRFWVWWMPPAPETYLRTDLIDAQEADVFYTGFATLAVVQFRTEDGLQPFRYIARNPNKADKINGFCYRLYELSVGYPSLRAAIENSEAASQQTLTIDPPQVLSGNVIEARHGGDKATQYECDRINLVSSAQPNTARLGSLQAALAENGQWDSHVKHGQNTLIRFSQTLGEKRRQQVAERLDVLQLQRAELTKVGDPASLSEWAGRVQRSLATPGEPLARARGLESGDSSTGIEDLDELLIAATTQARSATPDIDARGGLDLKDRLSAIFKREIEQAKVDLSSASGYLGSLKLTFSTIGIFSQEDGRWFWKSNQFYIRQDTADATYGSDVALDLSTTGGLFTPKRIKVTIPEPRLLALDRYTTVLVPNPRHFKLKADDPAGGSIEAALSDDLERQLNRIEPQAIRFTQAILTAQLHELIHPDVGEIEIKFSQPERGTPTQLMELLRLMREQQKE